MSEENNNEPSYTFWAEQVSQTQSEPVNNSQTESGMNSNDMNRSTVDAQPIQGFAPNVIPNIPVEPRKKNHAGKVFGFLGKAAVFGAVAGLAFYGTASALGYSIPGKNSNNGNIFHLGTNTANSIASTVVSKDVTTKSSDVSGVVAETMPSIVAITSTINTTYEIWGQQYQDEQQGGGSGIIIGKNDKQLFIATNNHVVNNATKITLAFIDGTTAQANVRGRNSAADLAVITVDLSSLKQETIDAIKVAKLGSSDDVKVGQMAIAIGNALGYGQSVTVGYISAKDRKITTDTGSSLSTLQTDAAINPGNSGGALINIKGEVIGINSAKLAQTSIEGMGYAIPIDSASPIVDELMNREILKDDEKGYLGLYPKDLSASDIQRLNWPQGVYVYELVKGGAAEKAGIYAGDIITGINNITVTTSDQLRETVTSYRSGTSIKVTLMRNVDGEFKEQTVDVVLQKNTESKSNK